MTADQPHALREYALLADGERGATLGPEGDIGWLCFPGWADPAVMAGLLGGGGGYAVVPVGRHTWGGSYEPGSLIWRSRWVTEDAVVESCDALAYPGERTRAVLLRRLRVVRGSVRVRVEWAPAADYGRAGADDLRRDDDGGWHGRLGEHRFRWDGAPDARAGDDGVLRCELELGAGERHDLVLVLDREDPGPAVDPDRAWASTRAAWAEACPALPATLAPRDAEHAVAVLRGMTCGGGGLIAAATMSLPEGIHEGSAYDYRYAWIRDQAMVIEAVASAGPSELLEWSTNWLRDRLLADGPDLRPAYTDGGGRVPDEKALDLPGYPGGRVTVGNHITGQFQLDVFGEALLALGRAAERDVLDADGWRAVEIAADAVARRRNDRDGGIWELGLEVWTHSRLVCAAGLRRVSALSAARGRAAEWLALADDLVAEASRTSLHPDGRWQRTPDDARIDAALLLPGLRGAVALGDPRTLATIGAVEAELVEDGYCYRFRPDERPLGEAEGAFLMCGFLMALALEREGRHSDALRWFERNRASCGPPAMLAEEFDVRQRQLRGNLPQAFVHALLLETAVALA